MPKQTSTETFEELLDERSMLRSELATKDILIEELRKENEVRICLEIHSYICTHVYTYIHTYVATLQDT